VKKPGIAAVVGATGIVYGDIGTSPLYAFEKSVEAAGSHDPESVLGLLSLISWSLIISVTVKYIVVVMRADNDGEGGVLAMLALAQRKLSAAGRGPQILIGAALLGTALFFCDGMITPAVTVLSAVEGLELLNPGFTSAVIPATLAVIAALFLLQRRGTAHVGKLFGPIMVVWFLSLAVSGFISISRAPQVLLAIDPRHGVELLATHPGTALFVIGAVFLAITGGEALYADMGHFGKTPVRVAWFSLVLPALLLNYYGQGALYLTAGPVPRPLYSMVSPSVLPFMILLATAASVIASQATISGAFSLARQAVQLDLLPRLRVLQTSAEEQGQIYVPAVNAILFVAVVSFVVAFQSSDAMSAAYGAAVIGTMSMTTVLGSYVAWTQWNWPKPFVVLVFGLLGLMDASFLVGNLTKVPDGGWIPLTLAACLFVVFSTWRSGRAELKSALAEMAMPIGKVDTLLEGVTRVPGTGVYLASDADVVPSALIRNLEHNHVVHERVLILNIDIVRTPRRDPSHRVSVEQILPQVYRITAYFGFMETPDVGEALRSTRARGLRVFMEDCSFFVGQHVVRARPLPGWRGLQRRLFARMQRRSAPSAEFFRMPGRGLVILTTAVEV
jgi:KUP system potassium uptake protein